ncbi:adenylate/guanylate cyclase domain-containing protein, partial [bacterium]|nr:adenylate/guanylate cyclase domain-containing protein [bacterium]
MDFTVIGDGVNLASRLENLNKVYGTNIIISEFTAAKLDERFFMRELDIVKVKGKDNAVTIFELIGFKNNVDETSVEMVKIFQSGLDAYRDRKWNLAMEKFNKVLYLVPNDGPSILYLDRIEEFKQKPPENGWSGISKFNHK